MINYEISLQKLSTATTLRSNYYVYQDQIQVDILNFHTPDPESQLRKYNILNLKSHEISH